MLTANKNAEFFLGILLSTTKKHSKAQSVNITTIFHTLALTKYHEEYWSKPVSFSTTDFTSHVNLISAISCRRGALGSIRNRKTAQNFRENRKTAIKIAQNRKTAEHDDENRKFKNLNHPTLDTTAKYSYYIWRIL